LLRVSSKEALKEQYLPEYLHPLTVGNGWKATLSSNNYANIPLVWKVE
jgi:hypothetical protein